jgi:hypothetical protein
MCLNVTEIVSEPFIDVRVADMVDSSVTFLVKFVYLFILTFRLWKVSEIYTSEYWKYQETVFAWGCFLI